MFRVQADSQMNCTSLVLNDGIPMMIEPILLDSNGDNIADLFGVNVNQTKGNYSWDLKSMLTLQILKYQSVCFSRIE